MSGTELISPRRGSVVAAMRIEHRVQILVSERAVNAGTMPRQLNAKGSVRTKKSVLDSSKRGPFRRGSARAEIFNFLLVPRTYLDFERKCIQLGVDSRDLLRYLRKYSTETWTLIEERGMIQFR